MKTGSIEKLDGGDLPMATAVAQGDQWSFRLGAVRMDGRVYRLIFAAHSLTPAVDARFRAAIRSFHRLRPEEAAETNPLRVRVVVAQDGDSAEALARRMPFERRAGAIPGAQRLRARRAAASRPALQDRRAMREAIVAP